MTNQLAVQGQCGLGLEEASVKDLILPHIILTQGLSKLVTEEKYPVGIYVNTLTKKQYGEGVEFVPFKVTKYINALKPQGGKMVFDFRVTDEADPRIKGRRFFNEKTADGETLKANADSVIAVLALVDGQPAVIKFSKTSYRAGKELLTMAKMAGGAFWAHKYKLVARKDIRDGNTYYVSTVSDAGSTTEAEASQAAEMYNSLSGKAKDVAAAPAAGEEEVPF